MQRNPAENSPNGGGDPAAGEDIYEIATMIEHLRHDDVNFRIRATKNLGRISKALGQERTREELIPFIVDSTDDEDEVLLAMAEAVGTLLEHVGGAEYIYQLLVPLEALTACEEGAVRDRAVESIHKITKAMPKQSLLDHFVPFLQRLADRDWFTTRMSATALFQQVYGELPTGAKEDLVGMYAKLCKDDTPMVRRVASLNLAPFVGVVDLPLVEEQLLPAFLELASDDQDSVRLQTVENCVAFAQVLPEETKVNQVLPVTLAAASDRSWRVRWSVANKFEAVCEAFGPETTAASICSSFERLLQDPEAEVRTAAASNATAVAKHLPAELVVSNIIPCIKQLVIDTSEHVRAALAANINDLAPLLGKAETINQLLPLLLQLLRDASSDVRLNIIAKLEAINDVIGVELLSQSLLPAIVDLAEDNKWRVRLAIIEHIPSLAQQLGPAFFNDKLSALCMMWLSDGIHSIRLAATQNLKRLTDLFGVEWAQAHILPRIATMHSHASHLQRMTALYAIQVLSESLTEDLLVGEALPMALHLAKDPVANVRFTLAKTLETLAPKMLEGAVLAAQVRPCLEELSEDGDRDVQFYSRKALRVCDELARH